MLAGLVIISGLIILFFKNNNDSNQYPIQEYTPITTPSDWVTLTEPTLGISLAVPPQIQAYSNALDPIGCEMSLILGTPDKQSIALMPEFTDCKKTVSLHTSTNFEDYLTKILTIIPVTEPAEILGAIKTQISNNYFAYKCQNEQNIDLASVKIFIPELKSNNHNATVPVFIESHCNINPMSMSVRYSPQHNKLIFVESRFGLSYEGVYFTNNLYEKSVDNNIFASIEVLF